MAEPPLLAASSDPPPAQRRGALAALAPLPLLLLPWLRGPALAADWVEPVGLGLGLLLLAAAYLAGRRPRAGLRLAAATALGFALAALPALIASPGLTLAATFSAGLALVWSFRLLDPPGLPHARPRRGARELELVRGACTGALCVGVLALPAELARTPLAIGAAALSPLGATLAALAWARRAPPTTLIHPWRLLLLCALAAWLAAALTLVGGQARVAVALSLLPVLAGWILTALVRRAPALEGGAWWEPVLEDPARLLVTTFLLTGAGGGLVLALPAASAGGQGVPLIDALFTSFSACCVTGLTTVDTARDWSGLGQVIVLLLIQVGGLGIMTFSSAGLVILGRRLSLRQEGAVLATLNQEDRRRLGEALLRTVGITLLVELLGALMLLLLFWGEGQTLPRAAWNGLFHAVSAYCNAGFALQTDSLVPFQSRAMILHTVCVLVILGGLGPAVAADLPRLLRRQRIPLQTKLALVVTVALLAGPALFFLLVEGSASMAHLSAVDRLHNAWFLAVTPRTAGFNATDMNALAPPTLALLLLLMFVGGSPGSTAGGIKTTTLGLLLLAVLGALRGRAEAHAFGFRVAQASIYKAVATTALGMASVLAGTLALLLTQTMEFRVALFEAVSALATVGLTIGGTGQLDSVGKVIVIACMFAGRVGPLSLFLLLASRQAETAWARPEQAVAVG